MNELRAHTGLRGLASLAVMASHLSLFYPVPLLLLYLGGPAVDLFFILSGFILCYVYHRPGERGPRGGWWGYHVARFARIYPIFFVVTMAMILRMCWFYRGAPWSAWPWSDFFFQLTLIFHWPFIFSISWNPPAWSISVEYFCYVFLFPLTFLRRPAFRRAALAVGFILLAQTALAWHLLEGQPAFTGWIGLIRGIVGFTTGVAVYHLYIHQPRLTALAARLTGPLVALAAAILVWAGWTERPLDMWWLLPVFPWAILALTDDTTRCGRVFSSGVFHFFGDISYGLYLMHIPFFVIVGGLVIPWGQQEGPLGVKIALSLGLAGAVILLAWLSYRFFEMPLRILIRRRLGVKTAKHAGESALPSINSPTA